MPQCQMLYKYRSLRSSAGEYTRRILEEQRIYYAAPGQFNDPFDCRFCISMENAPLTEQARARKDEIREYAEAWLRDENNNDVCVFSLSEVRDDILMWSHYADCHTGICLGIRIPVDNEQRQIIYRAKPAKMYFADFLPGHRDPQRFGRSVIDTLTIKSPHRAYEREWRCIDFGGKGERPLPANALAEVIFGCCTSDDDKRAVLGWLSKRHASVALLEATTKNDAFELDVRPVQRDRGA